jgi:hypothetical protein
MPLHSRAPTAPPLSGADDSIDSFCTEFIAQNPQGLDLLSAETRPTALLSEVAPPVGSPHSFLWAGEGRRCALLDPALHLELLRNGPGTFQPH